MQSSGPRTDSKLDLGVDVLDPDYVRATAERFAATLFPASIGTLRDRVLSVLVGVQDHAFPFAKGRRRPSYVFDESGGVAPNVLADLLTLDHVPDDWRYEAEDRAEIARRTDEAWALLERVAPEIAEMLALVCGTYVFTRQRKYAGGSISAHVGIIAWTPLPSWSVEEYAGHILHEHVHQLLFFFDMTHGIFDVHGDNLRRPEALVTSAVLRTRRPYDRAFHSAFVLHATRRFWSHIGRDDLHIGIPENLAQTLDELLQKNGYLLPYGLRTLRDLRREVGLDRPAPASVAHP